jgi:hypothetical protein
MVQVSPSVISKIEKGAYRCRRELAMRLDDTLATGGVLSRAWGMVFTDADKLVHDADLCGASPFERRIQTPGGRVLGSRDPSIARFANFVSGRQRHGAAGVRGALPVKSQTSLDVPTAPPDLPNKISLREIEQLRHTADAIHLSDNSHGGGGLVWVMARDAMDWAVRLLSVNCPEHLQSEFLAAVARLGIVVGASHFDAYTHDDARAAFRIASECATAAGDWHLRAKTYSGLARQAIWIGDPDAGLTYAETGLVRSERLTATERAMLHTARARAYGKMNDVAGTLTAVGQADDAFAQSKPAEDPPWMAYYDDSQHAGDTAHALFDLVMQRGQDPGQAQQRFETAVAGHGEAFKRSRAISRTKLASLIMAKGDPVQAISIGHEALDDVGRLTSRRAADDLRELGRLSGRHVESEKALQLRQRIRATLAV